jgi:hypothetical protein
MGLLAGVFLILLAVGISAIHHSSVSPESAMSGDSTVLCALPVQPNPGSASREVSSGEIDLPSGEAIDYRFFDTPPDPARITNPDILRAATTSIRILREIAPGVEHLHWHIVKSELQPGPWNINLLSIDLRQSGIEVRVVEAEGGLETVRSMCHRTNALAGVNGGYFGAAGPLGLVVTDGEIRSSTVSWKPPRAALGLYVDKAWIDRVDQQEKQLVPQNPTRWFDWAKARFVLGGGPRIVDKMRVGQKGRIDAETEGFDAASGIDPDGYTARTVVGVGRNQLYLMTVDGGQPGLSIGMMLAHAAGFMVRMCQAPYAMALDGGDSTTLVIQDRTINFPSGPQGEIPVANAICVYYRPEKS